MYLSSQKVLLANVGMKLPKLYLPRLYPITRVRLPSSESEGNMTAEERRLKIGNAFVTEIDRLLLDERIREKELHELIRERATFLSQDLLRVPVLFCGSFGGFGFSEEFSNFLEPNYHEWDERWVLESDRTLKKYGGVHTALRQFMLSMFQMQKPEVAAFERALVAFYVLCLSDVVWMITRLESEKLHRNKAAATLDMLRFLLDASSTCIAKMQSSISSKERETRGEEPLCWRTVSEPKCLLSFAGLSEGDLLTYTPEQLRRMEGVLTKELRRVDANEFDPTLEARFAQRVLPFISSTEERHLLLSTLVQEHAAMVAQHGAKTEREDLHGESSLSNLSDEVESFRQDFLESEAGVFANYISENREKHDIVSRCLEHASLQQLVAQQAMDTCGHEDVWDPLVRRALGLARGQNCSLRIRYVPALVDYTIEEYDGDEHVRYESMF